MDASSVSPFVTSSTHFVRSFASCGNDVIMLWILAEIDGTIAATKSTQIPTKNTSDPVIAIPRDVFFALRLLFIRGSKNLSRCPSKNFMIGFNRYAITTPIMIGCKIKDSFFQKSVNPL